MYLDVADLLEASRYALAPFGQEPEIRDWGIVSGALARPQAAGFGVVFYPTLFEKAAALLHGLASTQGLKDGNKRTAWAVTAVFLEINGHSLKEPLNEDAAEELVMNVALSELEVSEIALRLLDFFE